MTLIPAMKQSPSLDGYLLDHGLQPGLMEGAMEEIAISEFKAKCLAILEQVRLTKTPIRVTRFGKPVAEIVPPTVVMDHAQ